MASPYRVFTIEPEILKVLYKYVFSYPYEICANLKKTNENTLIPHNVLKGRVDEYITEKYRGTCSHKEYSSNILHTHPPSSYAYPSPEDIIKVIKHYGKIVNSLIVTKWGIWVVSNTTTSNIYSTTHNDKFYLNIKKYLDRIGQETRTSDDERERKVDKSRDLTTNDFILLSKINRSISDMLNIKIDLYSWDDIMTTGLIINGLTDVKSE